MRSPGASRYAPYLDSGDTDRADMATDAVERNIAIIGEAAGHLPTSLTDALPGVDLAAIGGMRNVLVRMYFGADAAVVRDVIETQLRPLDAALAALTFDAV